MALTVNDRRVMTERHHGWESASPSLLARVFGTTPQHVTAIVAKGCAVCGKPICGHRDDEWAGIIPSDGNSIAVAPSGVVNGSGGAGFSPGTPAVIARADDRHGARP